jgi:serine/threonine-protein kinase
MGVVYRGRDEGLDRDVAVKVMAMAGGAQDGHDRFLREARSAARLQHPNIVIIYELGEHDGAPFIAMELLEGLDLQQAIAGGLRLDPRGTLPIVLQVLAGLGHAHDHGVVHRDVKPSNVFLPHGRPAKVMDFGVARLAAGTTAAGVVVGTPNYMSPEQVRTGLVDGRSDLFSAGLILYELVTGEKVYRADSVVSLLYKVAHEPPALAELPAGPQWRRLREVVTRALQREPEDRYPDARSMADDLSQALADLGGAAPGPQAWDGALPQGKAAGAEAPPAAMSSSAAPESRDPSRRLALLALAVAAAALLAALGLFLFLRPSTGLRTESAAAPSAAPTAPPGPRLAASPTPVAVASAPPPAPAREAEHSPKPASPSPRPASTPDATETERGAGGDAARLEKAADLFERGRYAAALAEARAVLERNPGNAEAQTLVEDAEAAIVVEGRIKKAREALRQGDRERALQEARAGLAVAPSDARLLALFKEATR